MFHWVVVSRVYPLDGCGVDNAIQSVRRHAKVATGTKVSDKEALSRPVTPVLPLFILLELISRVNGF